MDNLNHIETQIWISSFSQYCNTHIEEYVDVEKQKPLVTYEAIKVANKAVDCYRFAISHNLFQTYRIPK